MNNTILEKLNAQVEKTVLSGKQFGSSLQKIKNQLMKGGVLKQKGGKKTNKSIISNKKSKLSNRKTKLYNTKKTKNKKRKIRFSKNR